LAPVLLEMRHVKAALSAMTVETDQRDARGVAQLLRMGWYRPVHRKSVPIQEIRALLGARKQLQIKVIDLELTVRGLLRGSGCFVVRRMMRRSGPMAAPTPWRRPVLQVAAGYLDAPGCQGLRNHASLCGSLLMSVVSKCL